MSFFGKIGSLLKKAVVPLVSNFVPGGAMAVQGFNTLRSAGEDRRKLALAKKANLTLGSMPNLPITRNIIRAPNKLAAPKISMATKASKRVAGIRSDQADLIKAGNVSLGRQKLLAEEWEMLGKPGTFKEYLVDQVRTGAVK